MTVFQPSRVGVGFTATKVPKKRVWVRNVLAVWTPWTVERGEETRIHAALTRLADN